MTSPAARSSDESWKAFAQIQAALLDGIEVAMCAFDEDDRAVAWNQTFLRLFPEHAGHITAGEHYSVNLRRFYETRLDAAEKADIERYIEGGVARHRGQTQPFEFQHRGQRLQVSSLPAPGQGRIRVWRTLAPLVAPEAGAPDLSAGTGGELLERVPEALIVCSQAGRVIWANEAFCELFGVGQRQAALGSTLEQLYERAWDGEGEAPAARRAAGRGLLRENLRFAGAPFELPLPHDRSCRVIARPARDGAVFYALIDISALKLYEASLQVTLDNAGRGIIRYDARGRVLLFNRQALELLDLPEDLVAGQVLVADVIRFQQERGDFAPTAAADLMHSEGQPQDIFTQGKYLRRARNGRILEISTHPLPDGGAVRTYSDVTDYLEAQRVAAEKSTALQITLDSMSQGIAAIDRGGHVVFWNRRYQQLLELPDDLLATSPTMETIVRFQAQRGDFGPNFEYVDAVARGYVAVGDSLAPLRGPENYVRRTRDGRTYDVHTRPLPDGGVVRTFSDITGYVRTQEALAQKQAQLGALVNNLPDRVWLKDAGGAYVLANPAFRKFHGLKEEDILGRTAAQLFGDATAARQAETDRAAFESDRPVVFERNEPDRFGDERCAEVVKVAMRNEDGSDIGLLGIARDITQRKRGEAALIQAKEAAQEASGAKSRFLSSMSHEIRTPMNAVLGMLTLLRSSELSARQEDYASKAEGAARALLSLLNDILDFSKIEAGKMRLDCRPFSLESLLSDLSVILSSSVGSKDLEVLYDLDPRVPDSLVGDDLRIRQILINLGGNAVKFTESGEVVVRTRLVASGPDGVEIEFSVQDSGIGMSEDQQKLLFTDYVQASDETARRFGGTGLGLGICRRLTELMDSTLELASEPGAGSRFWFTIRLPVAGVASALPPAAGITRVLIVDDNAVARETLAGLAKAAGWTVDTVEGGERAVSAMVASVASGLPYDAVFVDWLMPGVDGWQTCARIRKVPAVSGTPLVIMVTAHGREMLDGQPPNQQALLDGFLVKPVTSSMLRNALERSRHHPAPAAAAQALPAQPLAGLRLLLAEDNPVNQQIATELLIRQGARVEVAGNGLEALERLAGATSYHAVLMDVQMPLMDGLAATRELRKRFDAGTLPVIAMTANAMDTDREACLAAGMNDHVAKPFYIDDVVRAILRHVHADAAAVHDVAQAAGAAQEAVFDRADALARMGGDAELLQRVLAAFRDNLQGAASQLDTAMSVEELSRLAHSIKGMAGNVGAQALAGIAGDVQARAKAADGPAVEAMRAALSAAVADALRHVA